GAAGHKAGGPRKKSVSRSVKAGLQFPVGRIGRYLKKAGTRSASAPGPDTPSTYRPSSSTSLPRCWSSPATPPRTTRRAASSGGTCCSPSGTTRSSGSCWPASPSRTAALCPRSTRCCSPSGRRRRRPRRASRPRRPPSPL
uniref:Histone H2A n=1 Tax=Aegilops tauschii subsp. strangulata TaxID=200361 RepID=A0A453QYB0_AEGTS